MKIHGMTHGEVTEGKEIDGFDFAVFSLCGKGEMGRKVLAQALTALNEGPGFVIIDRLPLEYLSPETAIKIYWLLACMIARPVAQ